MSSLHSELMGIAWGGGLGCDWMRSPDLYWPVTALNEKSGIAIWIRARI